MKNGYEWGDQEVIFFIGMGFVKKYVGLS